MMFILLIAGFCFAMGFIAGWVIFGPRQKPSIADFAAGYAAGSYQAHKDVVKAVQECTTCKTCFLLGGWADQPQTEEEEK